MECVDAYKNRFSFTYDAFNRMLSHTDRRGYTFTYEYDSEGRCVHSRGQDGLHEVRLRYLVRERVTIVTKGDSGQWQYFYNENQVLTQVIDPYGGVVKYLLDERGRVAEEVDPNGNVSRMVYDPAGGLVGKRSPLGHVSPIPEDPNAPDPLAHRVPGSPLEWEFGDLIPRTRISPPASDDPVLRDLPDFAAAFPQTISPQRLAVLSPRQGIQLVADAEGFVSVEGRLCNDLGLPVKEELLGGGARHWSHDAAGNMTRYHDADGSVYRFEYTSWDLRSKVTDPVGHMVGYGHSRSGRITSVTDPGGTMHEFIRDSKDRVTQVRCGGTLVEEYQHDLADNLIEKRNGKGERLLAIEVGPGSLKKVRRLASGENHYFEYDQFGRYTRAATDDLEILFAYDASGNRIKELRDGLGVEHRFKAGRLAESTVFGKFTTHYEWKQNGTLTIRDPGGKKHELRLLEHGLVVRTLSSGSVEVSQFDSEGRCLLKLHRHPGPASRPWARTYRYSAEGELRRVEDSSAGTCEYLYDAAHRLVGARLPNGERQGFAYDPAGNLTLQPGLASVAIEDGNRLAAANRERLQYNDRGNVAARKGPDGETRYRYDARDMLTHCERGGMVWRARYDPLARRVSKSFGQRHVDYYWDMDRLAAEVDESGRVRIYVYADAFALVPMLFLEYDSLDADPATGRRYFLFCNQVGAPVLAEDDWGHKVWSARLDPYGVAHIDPSSQIDVPLRFAGHYWDEEIGLQYNRFRYYDPGLGRYLQVDPLGVGGGINVYAYPANPLAEVDVRGECPDGDPTGGSGGGQDKTDQQKAEEKAKRLAELKAKRDAEKREKLRQDALDEAIAKADAKGKRDDLSPDERAFVDASPENARLAIDPDGSGGYRVAEARAGQQAERDGVLPGPVRRATEKADPSEGGGDLIDGNNQTWDHKDSSHGADNIAKTANSGENVLVDCNNMSDADHQQLQNGVNNQLQPGAGDVKYVRRNDPT